MGSHYRIISIVRHTADKKQSQKLIKQFLFVKNTILLIYRNLKTPSAVVMMDPRQFTSTFQPRLSG